jgi:methyltransferase (TIGR00027 family)
MITGTPSRTAQRVAVRRAAHQLLDSPRVFDDPLALAIIGTADRAALTADPVRLEGSRWSRSIRIFAAIRSRMAEDTLAAAVARGVRQYVVLGAGLDTFAYRNPFGADGLQVFEVDHPATQAWKRTRLADAGIPVPGTATFVPVDFEHGTLEAALCRSGFDEAHQAFFSWLGGIPYLPWDTVRSTLEFIVRRRPPTCVVFDYAIDRSLMSDAERAAFDAVAERVRTAGEPWVTLFVPHVLHASLRQIGFTGIRDLGADELNARYCAGRTDGLQVGRLAHVVCAST